ncbi:hypothetical protein [Labrenzia sp. CP4]|jgi:hypothetical protein|nr:hypothetical protein [Labrenzia sp. CP4]
MDKEKDSLFFQLPGGFVFHAKGTWAIAIGAGLALVFVLISALMR